MSPRDLAACVVDGAIGATTVGGTLAACRLAGIRVMATGGIGGVHRGYAARPDVSADLAEIVTHAGGRRLLRREVAARRPATLEALETLGVPVIGFRTDTLPLFYAATGGPPVPARVDSRRAGGADRGRALGARARWRARARPRPRTRASTSSR